MKPKHAWHVIVSVAMVMTLGLAWWASREGTHGNGTSLLTAAELAGITGANPGYRSVRGGDYCSGSNLQGSQVAAYNCAGNNGATCILCTPMYYDLLSALENAGNERMQTTGGSDQSCSTYRKQAGICQNNGFGYVCGGPITDLSAYCSGTFPPMQAQPY